jgi:hypothetical protein
MLGIGLDDIVMYVGGIERPEPACDGPDAEALSVPLTKLLAVRRE